MVLPFWNRLTHVVMKKRLLNGCSTVIVVVKLLLKYVAPSAHGVVLATPAEERGGKSVDSSKQLRTNGYDAAELSAVTHANRTSSTLHVHYRRWPAASVYVTVGCPYVRPSVPSIDSGRDMQLVPAPRLWQRRISIDSCRRQNSGCGRRQCSGPRTIDSTQY